MPKLRISRALQYLLCFLGRNERNKCGGMPKWIYMVGKFEKKKSGIFKKTKWKKIWKKISLEQKQKGKKMKKEKK